MTRVLSELLGAAEPTFRQNVCRLESASGHSSADIQLSTQIERATKQKLKELGLDPHDTTGSELYAALQSKIKVDDERLTTALRRKYGSRENPVEVMSRALSELPVSKNCFALKHTIAKRLLAKRPPKQAMKLLGYRSFDSMMRREQLAPVVAAAWLLESVGWQRSFADGYKKLKSSDFEIRPLSVMTPHSRHWDTVSAAVVAQKKHTIIGLKELGTVVLLPFPNVQQPPAATITTLLLALHEMNEVHAASTFLKLCQVKSHFGQFVRLIVSDEPTLSAKLLDSPVPWQIIQRYYARHADRFHSELFEPHIQQDDMHWHSIEKALSHIEPSLAFWHHTSCLGLLHEHQPVSLNVIDAALNFCNQLPYANRIVHYLRYDLWHELIIRYLKHEQVEQAVLSSLESQLVEKPQLI